MTTLKNIKINIFFGKIGWTWNFYTEKRSICKYLNGNFKLFCWFLKRLLKSDILNKSSVWFSNFASLIKSYWNIDKSLKILFNLLSFCCKNSTAVLCLLSASQSFEFCKKLERLSAIDHIASLLWMIHVVQRRNEVVKSLNFRRFKANDVP